MPSSPPPPESERNSLGTPLHAGRGEPARKSATPLAEDSVGKKATRGGLWLLLAKIVFIGLGLIQQVVLGRVLGLGGYGALSTALAANSIAYNSIVQGSLQGVSRQVAQAGQQAPGVLRQLLREHAKLALGTAGLFFVTAPLLSEALGAPHITLPLRILSVILLLYGLYAPLIGALNGMGRLRVQAGFDMGAALLRTIGLIGGALLGPRLLPNLDGAGVSGAAVGFALSSTLVFLVALSTAGTGDPRSTAPRVTGYWRTLGPLLAGHVLLNLLFQVDALLLRRYAASAALAAGLPPIAADPWVGAYRAAQLFSFLPYQLLSSLTLALFPLVARAQADGNIAQLSGFVRNGLRIALIATGLMVSVLVAIPEGLVGLVYGPLAAEPGGRTLGYLAPGLGFLALLGVVSSCLNSLGRERETFFVTLGALVFVGLGSTALAQGKPLGTGLLERTALGTGLGLFLAFVVSTKLLSVRVEGAILPWGTVVRVLAAVGLVVGFGRLLPPRPLVALVAAPGLGVGFLFVLFVTGELRFADLRAFARRHAKK